MEKVISMGRFVNPDSSAFQVALNSKIYVDKTGLIEYTNSVLDTTDAYICNSRPRRFGKSYTANMLAAYYSKSANSEKMFSSLSIGQSTDFKKHLNQYDVIRIDMQWFLTNCQKNSDVVTYMSDSILVELKNSYPNVLPQSYMTLAEGLSLIKNSTDQKFIVIIDEWDVLIRDRVVTEEIQAEYLSFLRGMFKGVEPTKYIQLAYLTGILPIKKEKTQSAVNNLNEFTMLQADELASYIGFTETEVKDLCNSFNRDYDKVKKWYDGYLLDAYQIYNPKAVVSVMIKGKFRSYWSETGSYEVVVPLIGMNFDGLNGSFIEMLSGVEVNVDTVSFKNDPGKIKNRDDVLTYLIHFGYLAYNEENSTAFVPNEEIRQELNKAVKSSHWDQFIDFQQQSNQLLVATLNLDCNKVADLIENIHAEYASIIKYNDENSLSSTLSIAYLGTIQYYFKPIRELATGKGYADIVFLPKPEYKDQYPALVVELKWNKTVDTVINQIKKNNYPKSILDYTGDI